MSMQRKLYILFLGLGLLAATLAASRPASATLGEAADSVTTDRKALSAAQGATTSPRSYKVQEIVSDSTTIREYISPNDIVFAIAWNGLSNPDLTQLLGSYADEYHQALHKAPRKHGRRFNRVKTNRLVVEKWGHMRNLQGRAFVPNLIPPGVSVDDIK
jgi:hypothetical protein